LSDFYCKCVSFSYLLDDIYVLFLSMMKQHFPIFQHNPGLVFLDNAASTQKPALVIDGVAEFLRSDYANIHRGLYQLSEKSETLYHQSKVLLAELIGAQAKEIIYSYNASYCFNLLAQALCNSGKLGKGDKVLLWMREHHSNVLPWQTLSKIFGFEIEFIEVNQHFDLSLEDFAKKYDDTVKVISLSHVSNVTGKIIDVAKVKTLLREDTFFIVDGSQSVPHFSVNVSKIDCDAFVMTAHKMMGHTGLGILYLKHQRIKTLDPLILGGGTVKDVSQTDFSLQWNSDKWETGTPNIIGAISLLKALEFIQNIGGMEAIWEHEQKLVQLSNKGFKERSDKVKVIGSLSDEERVGVYAFLLPENNFNKIGEEFARENICIRAGGHCAYPLHKFLNVGGSSRMSSYVYNDEEDLRKFFEVLDRML